MGLEPLSLEEIANLKKKLDDWKKSPAHNELIRVFSCKHFDTNLRQYPGKREGIHLFRGHYEVPVICSNCGLYYNDRPTQEEMTEFMESMTHKYTSKTTATAGDVVC